MSLLAARGLRIAVDGRVLVDALDIALQPGERWALLGRNGAGKTTLLHTLAGLREPAAGTISLMETALKQLSRREIAQRLGLLLQDDEDPFPHTVLETALIGRHPFLRRWQWEGEDDVARAKRALAQMGLEGLDARLVPTLSGGERRRLGIATLLAQAPSVYLLDEPTNHLDLKHQLLALERLSEQIRGANRSMLVALHDVNLALRFCNRFLLLYGDGRTMLGTREDALTIDNLRRLYDQAVVALNGPHGPVFLPE